MKSIFQQILQQQHFRNSCLRSTKNLRQFCDHKPNDKAGNISGNQQPPYTKENLHKLIASNKVVVFMKGNPEAPRCGFSNAVVQILRMHGVSYDAHDVLLSDELRQNIKEFTEWPTIPQVFLNGEFIGGCDILLQMHQNGELIEELKKIGIQSLLLKEAKSLSSTLPANASANTDNMKKE